MVSAGYSFLAVYIRTNTKRSEKLDKEYFILAGIDDDYLSQDFGMYKSYNLGILVLNCADENVSDKVVKIIQSYTSVVSKTMW